MHSLDTPSDKLRRRSSLALEVSSKDVTSTMRLTSGYAWGIRDRHEAVSIL
ncbi:MAG: hypothetical protein ACFCAD_00900 [Pleurocapsa sp.]